MTDFGYTDEALRYGKHTFFQDEAIPVLRLLEHAVMEGRPLKLNWPGQNEAGRVADEPNALNSVMPRVPEDDPPDSSAMGFAGSDENTEPNTARREALRWFGPESFTWFPRALAG